MSMTDQPHKLLGYSSTPPESAHHDRPGPRRPGLVAGVNAAMGVHGIIPIWMAWFYLSNWFYLGN